MSSPYYPTTPDPYRSGMRKMSGVDSRGGIPGMSMTNDSGSATGGTGSQWWQGANAASGRPPLGGPQTGGTGYTGFSGPQINVGASPSGNSQFTPDNNLIGTQFNPTPSGRTQGAQRDTQRAKSAYGNYQFDPNVKGAYGAANDLAQGQQAFGYTPVAGTDLTGARNYLAQAGANVGPSSAASGLMGMGETGSFDYSQDTKDLRGMTKGQLDKLLNSAPDRTTLASNSLKRLIDDTNPQFEQDLRGVNKKAAAMGWGGAGMVTQDLGTVAQRRNEQIIRRSQELADQAAGLTLQDEQDKLNASRGVMTDFGGMDTAAGGLNLGYMQANNQERAAAFDRARATGNDTFNRYMDLSGRDADYAGITRNDNLTERDAMRTAANDQNDVLRSRSDAMRRYGGDLAGYDQDMFSNRRSQFNDFANEEQRLYGNDMNNLNFQRGERDYQYGLSRDAQQDRINQRLMEEDLLNSRFRRGQGAFDAGYSQNPSGVIGGQGQGYADDANANYDAMGNLFGTWAMNRNAPRPAPTPYSAPQPVVPTIPGLNVRDMTPYRQQGF